MGKKRKPYYLEVRTRINDRIEVERHYDAGYGAPGMERAGRKKRTPEEMARQNLWQRKRYVRRLAELNFKGGDWHVVLTCSPELRPSKEEAPAVIRKFRDKLRAEYKKQGWELKYIYTCEVGERGAVHWHMIVNDQSNDRTSTHRLIARLWERGRPYFTALDANREYGTLTAYMLKEAEKRIKAEKTIEKLSYTCSRNLIKPVSRQKKKYARIWRKDPKAPAGYMVIPDSLVNGINKFNGWPYQYYQLRKIPGGKEKLP